VEGRRLRLVRAASGATLLAFALVGTKASADEPTQAPPPTDNEAPQPAATSEPATQPPLPETETTAAEVEAEVEAEADTDAAVEAEAQPPKDSGPNEVRVNGRKTEATAPKDTIGGREIRQVPGAFGDAFRAIDSLPGVTPIVSGLPYFFVRGAPPGNTGFFIDGVRVPGLFHLGVGPAVMYPALIDHVDLYKGAYPVSFGRFAGGILSAETVKPSERTRADWTVRLFDVGALVEAPFGKEKEGAAPKGSVAASGRYGYPGLLLSVFAPDAGLAYWDYQTRASYKITDRDTFSVLAFGSYDSVSQRDETHGEPDAALTEVLNIQFHRVDFRWDRKTSSTGSVRTAVTAGYDRTGSQGFAARSFMLGSRVYAQERLTKGLQIRAGADAQMQTYDFRLGERSSGDETPAPDEAPDSGGYTRQNDVNIGAWVDAPLKLAPKLDVTPGLRADIYTSRGVGMARALPALDPRITTRIGIGPLYYIGGVGIAHQPAAFPLPIPALTFAQLRRGLQGGYHLSQGLEIPLPGDLTATTTGYLHTYTGIVDLAQQCNVDDPKCNPAGARGQSVGLEAMVKRNLGKRVGGWISYTLSRSTRDTYDATVRRNTSRLSEFDRTHVFNVVLSVDLGKGWRVGGRYATYSGIPYSTLGEGLLPNARTPAFHRLDFRLEKRWVVSNARSFALTAEMFNVLLMKEPIGITCSGGGRGAAPACRPEAIGPIAIPSLGFEGTL
jgi:hypothetical protein